MIIQSKNVWVSGIFTEAQIEIIGDKIAAIYPIGTRKADFDYGEIICNGNHVDWAAVYAFVMSKGKDYCIMIDDALCAKGCKPGHYELGGNPIEIRENGSAYISGTNTLAGGTLRFNAGLRNLIEKALIPVDRAINMVTLNPARYLGGR